jgi:hypothetical protein
MVSALGDLQREKTTPWDRAQFDRPHGACPRGLVTGSQIRLHREVIAATGLVPVERRLSTVSRGSTGQARWRPSMCTHRLLAISHRSTGTGPVESVLYVSFGIVEMIEVVQAGPTATS